MEYRLEKSLEVLSNTPTVVSALLSNLSEEWTNSSEGENTWTAKEVIAHLIVCEKTNWLPRTRIILSNSKEIFVPIDMKIHLDIAADSDLPTLLNLFEQLRENSLIEIKTLNIDDTDLLRTAIHPRLGEVNLQQLIATWVTHDLTHIAQIARILAKQNKDYVGEFKVFLNILKS